MEIKQQQWAVIKPILSQKLEAEIEQYMKKFPRRIYKKPASINKGAFTFKIVTVKPRSKSK